MVLKEQLRNLDIDDLIIMSDILEAGAAETFVLSKKMRLTPPAISHRLRKYKRIFGEDIFFSKYCFSQKKLTVKGQAIFKQCSNGLRVLLNEKPITKKKKKKLRN